MYVLRAFVNYPSLVDNALGAVAPLGELSKNSLTYSKETGQYRRNGATDIILHTFGSHQETTGEEVVVPNDVSKLLLDVSEWLYEQAIAGNLSQDSSNTTRELNFFFSDVIEDLSIGRMVSNGTLWLPEWISFSLSTQDSYIRLWFSDEAFSYQYSQYEYSFIAPVKNLDVLFESERDIRAALKERDYITLTEIIEEKRGSYPFTYLKGREYDWVDPKGIIDNIPMNWTVLIYGEAGNNSDRIRSDLANWILENSSYTREQWIDVLPSIFTPTEFIVTPLWSQYAIANKTIQAGIYSPLVSPQEAIQTAQLTAKGLGYSEQDVANSTMITTVPYKSLCLLFTGNAYNKENEFLINGYYPDYITVPLQSRDFSRMSPTTQAFTRQLNEMLMIAEKMTDFDFVPTPYSRISRDGIVYLYANIENVSYLMVSRMSMAEIIPPNSLWYDDSNNNDDCIVGDIEGLNENTRFVIRPDGSAFIDGVDSDSINIVYTLFADGLTIENGTKRISDSGGYWMIDFSDRYHGNDTVYEFELEFYNRFNTKLKEGVVSPFDLRNQTPDGDGQTIDYNKDNQTITGYSPNSDYAIIEVMDQNEEVVHQTTITDLKGTPTWEYRVDPDVHTITNEDTIVVKSYLVGDDKLDDLKGSTVIDNPLDWSGGEEEGGRLYTLDGNTYLDHRYYANWEGISVLWYDQGLLGDKEDNTPIIEGGILYSRDGVDWYDQQQFADWSDVEIRWLDYGLIDNQT